MLNIILKRLSTITGAPLEGAEPTRILLHDDGITIVSTRIVKLRTVRVITTCDGTTGDFAKKAKKLAQLDDSVYETFGRLQDDELTSED